MTPSDASAYRVKDMIVGGGRLKVGATISISFGNGSGIGDSPKFSHLLAYSPCVYSASSSHLVNLAFLS